LICLKISFSIKEVNQRNLISITKEELEYIIKEMKSKKKMKIVQIAKKNLNKNSIRIEGLVLLIQILINKMM